jgi:2-polyprenyl-3-methyl-5-hydroxy-6-metoxy-1,4-benzoquinol methylase
VSTRLAQKIRNVVRALVQRYGPASLKRHLWNREFSTGRWTCLESTVGEGVHSQVEKYANHGGILDLGCGPGAISVEVNTEAYSFYSGVDISDVAIQKARKRAEEVGRADRNQYCQSDILTYTPQRQFDVILYGDSIYYIPNQQIAPMLCRYSTYLTKQGVFIARLFDVSGKHRRILDIVESHFDVVEKHLHELDGQPPMCVIVFQPRT